VSGFNNTNEDKELALYCTAATEVHTADCNNKVMLITCMNRAQTEISFIYHNTAKRYIATRSNETVQHSDLPLRAEKLQKMPEVLSCLY
jgi:hypothetical protein